MKLKFIGADGSMGLKKGKVYDVDIETIYNSIWVKMSWKAEDNIYGIWRCPYDSPQSFAENWTKP